jgi:hypothetical protein
MQNYYLPTGDIYKEIVRRFYTNRGRVFSSTNKGEEITGEYVKVLGVTVPLEDIKIIAPKVRKTKLDKAVTIYYDGTIRITRKLTSGRWKLAVHKGGNLHMRLSLKPSYEGLSVFVLNNKGKLVKSTFAELSIFNDLPTFCLSQCGILK